MSDPKTSDNQPTQLDSEPISTHRPNSGTHADGIQLAKRLPTSLVISSVIHAAIFIGLGWAPSTSEASRKSENIDFELIELPEKDAVLDEVSQPTEAETAPPKVKPKAVKPKRTAPAPKADEPPAAAPETPVDLTGLTLTNENTSNDGNGWSAAAGNGETSKKPIGPIGIKTDRVVKGTGNTLGGTGTRVVPVGSLSRPPAPPNLDRALSRNYPKDAKQQGIEGIAKISARVMPTGKLSRLRIVSESYQGFGQACRNTLTSSPAWTPPRDRQGKPAATDITYTCRFEVR